MKRTFLWSRDHPHLCDYAGAQSKEQYVVTDDVLRFWKYTISSPLQMIRFCNYAIWIVPSQAWNGRSDRYPAGRIIHHRIISLLSVCIRILKTIARPKTLAAENIGKELEEGIDQLKNSIPGCSLLPFTLPLELSRTPAPPSEVMRSLALSWLWPTVPAMPPSFRKKWTICNLLQTNPNRHLVF